MANEGVNLLARILSARMKALDDRPPIIDFGSILENMSLRTNNFPIAIPATDYVICRAAADLRPGDRVFVAWAGDDPVVVDVICREFAEG